MQPTSLPRPSDRWIPWYFVAFFVVLIATLVPMGVIAVRGNTGLVTDDPYDKGLAYNKAIQADAQQKALNWHGDAAVTVTAAGKAKIDFTLKDAAGKPLDATGVKAWLIRPTQDGMDQSSSMTAAEGGHYAAEVALPARGLWEVRVSAVAQGQNFQLVKRVVLP